MRVRLPIAATFVAALFVAGYLGFGNTPLPNDKLVHLIMFFVLTILFYWSIDSTRKRNVNVTFLVCTLLGGIGSEFAQDALTERVFDYHDIAANIIGSLFGTVLSSWYHGRLIERRRKARYERLRSNMSGETEAQTGSGSAEGVELNALAPEPEPVSA